MHNKSLALVLSSLSLLGIVGSLTVRAAAPPQRKAIIVYHNDWGGAAPAVRSELTSRGYTVTITDTATVGLQAITQASTSLRSGDFLVVYLAGHGSNPRAFNDTAKATALEHFVEFNSGILKVRQTAPLFEKIAQTGVKLTVIDGSCNGGETVLYAMGQPYCALATAGVFSPSLTNFPYPSNAMHRDATPGRFGGWADHTTIGAVVSHVASFPEGPPYLTAGWMNGEIITTLPERINQRLFRNDNTDFANLSLFLRPSIGFLTGLDLGGWNLHYQYCYLYRFIYPDDFAKLDPAEKSRFTNSLATYLAAIHSTVDPAAPRYATLRTYLTNPALLNQAAKVYAAQYSRVWQTLANDPAWNVDANPGLHGAQMRDLTPDAYRGEAGFLNIAGEIDWLLSIMERGFEQQELLLGEIDAVARGLFVGQKLPEIIRRPVKMNWPPEPGSPTLKFNQFERAFVRRIHDLDLRLKVRRQFLLRPATQVTGKPAVQLVAKATKADALKAVNEGVETYKGSFTTLISEKVGFPVSSLDPARRQRLELLIGRFKAIAPTLAYAEARISFLLSIVEDAMVTVQAGGPSPSSQVPF
jgi:hypothetical protein